MTGHAHFEFHALPRLSQVSPGFGILIAEINGDAFPDVLVAQNFYGPQPETGRMDGGLGQLLLGDKNGNLRPLMPRESGIVVPGDGTAVAELMLTDQQTAFLFAVNSDRTLAFGKATGNRNPQGRVFKVALMGMVGNRQGYGSRVTVYDNAGNQQTAELSAGSGYLSQTSAFLSFGLPSGCLLEKIRVQWPDGATSEHQPELAKIIRISRPVD